MTIIIYTSIQGCLNLKDYDEIKIFNVALSEMDIRKDVDPNVQPRNSKYDKINLISTIKLSTRQN